MKRESFDFYSLPLCLFLKDLGEWGKGGGKREKGKSKGNKDFRGEVD